MSGNLLYEVIKAFAGVDLSLERVDNMQMGYVFEELIRIGAEQANEESRGALHTARSDPFDGQLVAVAGARSGQEPCRQDDLRSGLRHRGDAVCGRGTPFGAQRRVAPDSVRAGLQRRSVGGVQNPICCSKAKTLRTSSAETRSPTTASICAPTDRTGRSTTSSPIPPFGVEWKQQRQHIERERDTLGFDGRFGAGLPRINDGSLLFLQHMISKMQPADSNGGGSRIAIVFNGSPLFTGDAGSGESDIRRWIIENDWLEAIVALPDQMFYNTGIATYIWVLTNRKEPHRAGQGATHRRSTDVHQDAKEPGQQTQRTLPRPN